MRLILLLVLFAKVGIFYGQSDSLPKQIGIASYYAKKFEGRKCSCGEKFRNDSLTAAHKTLPFGTKVKVTNLKNDSVVIVRINDRLPKKSKRIIDLTRRAAKQLNFVKAGLTKVSIEVLKDSIP
ncbi:septal ring lytic transglycosylase RlpA family lipoprotein [Sphingobacteriaceae bacterium]|nr:septal ring lytic transglycosylase RlpA family lipoprotein [Sphingobacteriaceae bacterium]